MSVILEHLLFKPGVQKHSRSVVPRDQNVYVRDQNVCMRGPRVYVRDQKVYVHLMRKLCSDVKTKVSGYFMLIAKKKAVAV